VLRAFASARASFSGRSRCVCNGYIVVSACRNAAPERCSTQISRVEVPYTRTVREKHKNIPQVRAILTVCINRN